MTGRTRAGRRARRTVLSRHRPLECKEVGGGSEDGRLSFDATDGVHEHLPAVVVIEPLFDIDDERARPFDGQQFLNRETGLLELSGKLVRPLM